MFFSHIYATLLVAVVGVTAQSVSSSAAASVPTDTTGISACVLNCTTSALTAGGCTAVTDIQCICTSDAFQEAAAQCLEANCTAADQAAAIQLEETECAAITNGTSSSASGSGTAAPSSVSTTGAGSSSSGSASSTSIPLASSIASSASSAAASATKSSAAGALAPINVVSATGALLSVVGLLVGAASVL